MKKNRLKIRYESGSMILGAKYILTIFDNDADAVSQIFADSLEVAELDGDEYLKCYRRGLVCNLIYLNNISHIYYEANIVKYYTDLSINTLKSILEKNLEEENMKND